MIPSRQNGRSRIMLKIASKNAGIPPEAFDKIWDECASDDLQELLEES